MKIHWKVKKKETKQKKEKKQTNKTREQISEDEFELQYEAANLQ